MKRLFILLFAFFVFLSSLSIAHADNPRFIDMNNGTMYDTVSSLIWLKNANCFDRQTWDNAIVKANSLANGQCSLTDGTVAGDWHLPTVDELRIFVDAGYRYEALNVAGFTSVLPNYYWPGTSFDTNLAWYVNMSNGYVSFGGGDKYDCYLCLAS